MMKIQELNPSCLIEYENNPRRNENAVEAVAASIREFGFKVPIVIDENNVIIAGHTRLKAARLLGLETVPCIVADDLTPEQIRAFRLADNKVGELAGWDFAKLEEELLDLSEQFDMNAFGFVDEIDDIGVGDLDREEEKEGKVRVTVTFDLRDWKCVENEIKDIIETNNGDIAVKMV